MRGVIGGHEGSRREKDSWDRTKCAKLTTQVAIALLILQCAKSFDYYLLLPWSLDKRFFKGKVLRDEWNKTELVGNSPCYYNYIKRFTKDILTRTRYLLIQKYSIYFTLAKSIIQPLPPKPSQRNMFYAVFMEICSDTRYYSVSHISPHFTGISV